jgi:NAD(P) transhydrogenase subunit alpha
VILCGYTNFPALMPSDASQFFARNLHNFLLHLLDRDNGEIRFKDPLADELSIMTLITHQGQVRFETTKNAKKVKAG